MTGEPGDPLENNISHHSPVGGNAVPRESIRPLSTAAARFSRYLRVARRRRNHRAAAAAAAETGAGGEVAVLVPAATTTTVAAAEGEGEHGHGYGGQRSNREGQFPGYDPTNPMMPIAPETTL